MFNATVEPDGRLRVPRRIKADGPAGPIRADVRIIIGPDDPDYANWYQSLSAENRARALQPAKEAKDGQSPT